MGKVRSILEKYEDFAFIKGSTEDEVKKAEEQLGLEFDPDFREFILECGCATANGHELMGVVENKRLNTVFVTLEARKRNLGIPGNLYVIEDLATDKILTWQDEEGVLYQTVGDGEPERINKTLEEYVEI